MFAVSSLVMLCLLAGCYDYVAPGDPHLPAHTRVRVRFAHARTLAFTSPRHDSLPLSVRELRGRVEWLRGDTLALVLGHARMPDGSYMRPVPTGFRVHLTVDTAARVDVQEVDALRTIAIVAVPVSALVYVSYLFRGW
jgi:hypothetical protein